jgi:hypothetical protein
MPEPSNPSPEQPTTTAAPPTTPTPSRLAGPALWIAGLILVGWCVFTVYLVRTSSGLDEIQWTRLTWLFSSVEAVVFAAAGALFGTSIQRQRTEAAEQRADANAQDATAGRTLAAALAADESGGGPATRGGLRMPAGATADDGDVIRRHAQLARALFPRTP